ncbi:unnamed protein product [Adineta steineri]|uniref:LicD/FKTN/FKRP nucleotidyltransferase domain-containing protein n=1 Tax=Adineta steineri TaxID=433720 RepID=A0A819K624_9BILA|nr:unnamed protein product [Adineta steineri]CAF3944332.1 unnamed protein product [Adineta steineri]
MGLIRLLYHNKSMIIVSFLIYILFLLIIQTIKQSNDPNQTQQSSQYKYRSKSTFYFIINYLFQSKFNLILIDPHVLRHLFIHHISFDQLEKPFITFAIHDESVERLIESLQDVKFSIKISTDHIFIEYENKTVHLAILHKYNSYYLIHKNTLLLSNDIHLSYGDKLRAVEHMESELHEYLFYYPRNVSHFLWLYKTCEFLYCNRELADKMENEFHLRQNITQLQISITPMKNVAYALDKLEKHYWLAGGALLGWYRHCGLIPFTEDADFGLYAEEYDESIRNYFLGNPVTYLYSALGLVNDSLEFRLYTDHWTLDLFWTYREEDHRWCGYLAQRAKYRRTLPLLEELCSCDLFGHRFTIPCSPTDYLDDEYGRDKWKTPLRKDYVWTNINYHSVWNDISWMYAVRFYTSKGKLRTDKFAIDSISEHFNYSLTSIPSFLNVIPNEPVILPPLKTNLVYHSLLLEKMSHKKQRNE